MEQTEVVISQNATSNVKFFGRLMSIIFEPKQVFESIKIKPALLIQTIFIIILLAVLAVPKAPIGIEYTKNMLKKMYSSEKFMKTQQISMDTADKLIEQQMKFVNISNTATAVIGPLFILFIGSAVLYGVCKVLKGQGTFKQTFAVLLYAYTINIIGELVRTVNVVLSGNYELTNSVTLFMVNDKTNFFFNLLNSLDIFAVWGIIVVAYGLSVVHNISKKKSYIWVSSVWVGSIILYAAYVTMQAASMYKQYGITL